MAKCTSKWMRRDLLKSCQQDNVYSTAKLVYFPRSCYMKMQNVVNFGRCSSVALQSGIKTASSKYVYLIINNIKSWPSMSVASLVFIILHNFDPSVTTEWITQFLNLSFYQDNLSYKGEQRLILITQNTVLSKKRVKYMTAMFSMTFLTFLFRLFKTVWA